MSLSNSYLDHLDARLEKQGGRSSLSRLLLVARIGEGITDPDAVVRYHERVRVDSAMQRWCSLREYRNLAGDYYEFYSSHHSPDASSAIQRIDQVFYCSFSIVFCKPHIKWSSSRCCHIKRMKMTSRSLESNLTVSFHSHFSRAHSHTAPSTSPAKPSPIFHYILHFL